jgi:AcrR family transcriptional regulator
MSAAMGVTMREDEQNEVNERRRTGTCEGARVGGRSERVVRDVRRAAAIELARVGYTALRIEDVAAAAGVNKTTIYRRWPTKADLIAEVVRGVHAQIIGNLPDTGTLRGDLLEMLRQFARESETEEGRGVGRMIMAELYHPEVEAIALASRQEFQRPWLAVLERGVARGELPPGTDLVLVHQVLFSPILARRFRLNETLEDRTLQAVVDLVLEGAKNGGAVAK